MTKVKRKILGRPRRSQNEVDLHAIGQRIRQIRDEVTQEDFALSLGISQAQLSKYELGQSALPLGALVKLTLKFGRTADWILTGKS
jgi:transcriptional regulator with XRE-family HTH domain